MAQRVSSGFSPVVLLVAACAGFLLGPPAAHAQTDTATLSGTVSDTTGAIVPAVSVTVTNTATGLKQSGTSNSAGLFTIPLLPPGNYTLSVQHPGFAPVEMRNVVLQVGARVALDVKLRVGELRETVTVSADAGQIQLKSESGERSESITNRQIRDVALPGRNLLYLMQTIPGMVPNGGLSWGNLVVNGSRGTMKEMSVDGAPNIITGANIYTNVGFDPEVVGEMKILTSNFQAEYGKAGSAYVQMTTRSGTKLFHGGLRYFRRDGALNANSFFNNAQGLPRPVYRYNYYGYDIGGPVIIPGTRFNKERNKLFFFWSQEYYRQLVPGATSSIYVPTQAERNGDFSRSTDGNGNPIVIRDPNTSAPFPGNLIPQSRIYQYGPNILSVLPMPNTSVGGTRYNYTSQASTTYPHREDILRVDYNINDKTRVSGRMIRNSGDNANTFGGAFNLAWNFPLARMGQTNTPINLSFTVIRTFSPTLTNEFIFGHTRRNLKSDPASPNLLRSTYGIDFPLMFPDAPGVDFLPSMQFGGIANRPAPTVTVYLLPKTGVNNVSNIVDNVMKVSGNHIFKVGIFIQRSLFGNTPTANTNPLINFANNANNPINTGDPYANVLLGIYSTYQQANTVLNALDRYNNVEPYLQDTWKISRRLTLDAGLRFSWIPPQYDVEGRENYFVPSQFDPAKAVRLYTPVLVGRTRRAVDPANMPATPTTQNTLPTAYIGLIVPGSGDPYNGIQQVKNGYYPGGFENRGVQWGPRFGFAYDLTGNGKMVIRGGYGISYDRTQGNVVINQVNTLPTVQTPQLLYGYLSALSSASGYMAPSGMTTYAPDGKVPNVQSFSLGVQRNLGFGTLVDIAYVGSLGRHLVQAVNVNGLPYLTTFQREAQDPSLYTPSGVVPNVEPGLQAAYARAGFNYGGAKALPVNFLRPYSGYGDVNYRQFTGSSNYHSLQVSLKRAIGRGLTFGVAYTWSKAFDTGDADFNANNVYDTRRYDYKVAAYDRTHVLVVNYVYDLPRIAMQFRGGRVASVILNDWHISGISQYSSGPPAELGLAIQGINAGQRILGTYSIQPRLYRYGGAASTAGDLLLNPDAYYAPNIGDIGPYPRTYLRQPGWTNHDISVYKDIRLGRERVRYLQLRVEMFNAFNHTEFSSINGGTQLVTASGTVGNNIFTDYPNVKITNSLRPAGSAAPLGQYFGEYNGARDGRVIQVGAKLYF
jgi:hypothetical protein